MFGGGGEEEGEDVWFGMPLTIALAHLRRLYPWQAVQRTAEGCLKFAFPLSLPAKPLYVLMEQGSVIQIH